MKGRLILSIAFVVISAGCMQDDPVGPVPGSEGTVFSRSNATESVNQQLAAVRQATVRYRSTTAAELLEHGYVDTGMCVPGMGIHFVRFNEIDEVVDPLSPEILVFEPKPHGRLQLVAVEYMALGAASPVLFGRTMDPSHLPFAAWELHAWVWKGNPDGIFNSSNPNVTCPSP